MYSELQLVKSVRKLSDIILEGCTGTIVHVYVGFPQAYEVEFYDNDYKTLEVLTVNECDIARL